MVWVYEDKLRSVGYKNVHFIKYCPERFVSKYDGRVYGPAWKCQVLKVAEDVAEDLLKLGYVEESKLTPEEQDKLFKEVFIKNLSPRLKPHEFIRHFYSFCDHRFGYEGNVDLVKHMTERLNEMYAPPITTASKVIQDLLKETEEWIT